MRIKELPRRVEQGLLAAWERGHVCQSILALVWVFQPRRVWQAALGISTEKKEIQNYSQLLFDVAVRSVLVIYQTRHVEF